MNKVRVLLVGIGGYGQTYAEHILNGCDDRITVAGLADPYPQACRRLQEFLSQGVPLYDSMEAFFAAGGQADLAVISSPIQFHTQQITLALEKGLHVLCEKPLCGDARDIAPLLAAAKKAGKYVGIGFQWSHAPAILALKQAAQDGTLGSCLEMKTLVLWPRDAKYYARGIGWAGKKATPDGQLIYDSVINNATAHYLHNMFFILGQHGRALEPASFTAELYRANPIENFDTAKVDMTFPGGASAHIMVAHAVETQVDPLFVYRFARGTVCFSAHDTLQARSLMPKGYTAYGHIQALMDDGSVLDFGDPFENQCRKLTLAVDAALSGSTDAVCGIEAASVHTRIINEMQERLAITTFAPQYIEKQGDLTFVAGLADRLMEAFRDPSLTIGGAYEA